MIKSITTTFDFGKLLDALPEIQSKQMSKVKKFVDETIKSKGRYLNSGVYIGKTEFIKEIFEEAIKYAVPHGVTMGEYHTYLSSNPKNYPQGSQDQDIFRFLEPKFYPRLKVDYQNKMAYRS